MNTARPLPLSVHLRRDGSQAMAFQCGLAALTTGAGVLSLLHHSWLRHVIESWIDMHVCFGSLLIGVVVTRLYSIGNRAPLQTGQIREWSRELSRMVYLILYMAIGIRQIIGIASRFWHGSDNLDLFDPDLRNAADFAGFDPKNDLRAFLTAGLVALVCIRVLLYCAWLRLSLERRRLHLSSRGRSVSCGPDVRT